MGLLSWWRGEGKGNNNSNTQIEAKSKSKSGSQDSIQPKSSAQPKPNSPADYPEVPGMNGAVAVPGATDLSELTIFEFGSVANSQFTMSGYCPVSNDLEPCVWQLEPASNPKEPLFRVVF